MENVAAKEENLEANEGAAAQVSQYEVLRHQYLRLTTMRVLERNDLTHFKHNATTRKRRE